MASKPTDRLLEIGCGNLRAGRQSHRISGPGHYYGIDISPEILLSAQQVIVEDQLQDKLPQLNIVTDLTLGFFPRLLLQRGALRTASSRIARSR